MPAQQMPAIARIRRMPTIPETPITMDIGTPEKCMAPLAALPCPETVALS
jgi:hypothetical protein